MPQSTKQTPRRRWSFGRRAKSLDDGSVTLSPTLIEVIRGGDGAPHSLDEIYKTVASVRTVVDMLSLHFAQVGLKSYTRVSDLDRQLDTTSASARLLADPNLDTPPARFMRATAVSYFVFGNAYWWVREDGGRVQLLLMPPAGVKIEGGGLLLGDTYTFYPTGNAEGIEVPKTDLVHFMDDPDPMEPRIGISRLAALRADLNEGLAMGRHMTTFWENLAQTPAVIERPLAAPEWSPDARERFEKSWANRYAGTGNAGKTGVLEEGMTLKELSAFSAQATQVFESRVFTLEAVARTYGVPISVLGLGDQASYGSQKEFHKALYQDTLGPHFRVFEDEINKQLLPRFAGSDNRYVEFNVAEKLQGAFDEQVTALSTALAGEAFMTQDEVRARLNLPQEGGDAGLLNKPTPEPVAPVAPAPDAAPLAESARAIKGTVPNSVRRRRLLQESEYADAMAEFFARQERTVSSRLGAKAAVDEAFDVERWDRELAGLLVKANKRITVEAAERAAKELGGKFDAAFVANYLSDHAEKEARMVNATTLSALTGDDVDVAHVFEVARTARAQGSARTAVTRYNAFGRTEGAKQAGAAVKTWVVTSSKSRHPQLDGETVPVDQPFSNGGMWPGDPALPTDETAHCECAVDF